MGSVYEEISRLETAKSDIETAIETCGVNVPDTELIDTYASYIRQIPSAVFSGLNVDPVGGADQFIQSIKQTNGLIEATVGGLVSTSSSGLVPKADGSAGVINSPSDDYVLTYKGGTIDWYKLPANAFKNDDNNTTYTFTSGNGGFTVTPSNGSAQTVSIGKPATAGTADKLAAVSKTAWGQTYWTADGVPTSVSGDMTGVGVINGILNLNTQVGNASLYLETASNNTDYAHLFVSNKKDKTNVTRPLVLQLGYGNVGIGVAQPSQKLDVDGNVKATSFIGNLDGNYINKLTGYTKATSTSALAATDTLNAALGKLEYKTDVAYNLVKGAYDGDGTIENLAEILKVLEGIKDTETIQAIIGKYLPLAGGTMTGALSFSNNAGIYNSVAGMLAYVKDTGNGWTGVSDLTNTVVIGTTSASAVIRSSADDLYHYNTAQGSRYKILDALNYSSYALPLSGGVITGALDLTNSPNSSDGYKMGAANAGHLGGGIHFKKNGANDWGQAITWSYSDETSHAGIYVKSSGAYGTKMYLCTTNLFVDGAKAALEIDAAGKITALRNNFVGNLTGNASTADSATIAGDGTITIVPQYNNEINFGGTNVSSTLYFGYRATGSKPIPTAFVFGGSSGSASITASKFIKSGGTSSQFLKADGSVDSNTYVTGGPYLPLAGGVLTGPVTFANGTWNVVGDDAAIGDYNTAGSLGLKSVNNNIPSIGFHNSSNTLLGTLKCDAGTLKWNTDNIVHGGNYNAVLPVKLLNDPGQTVLKNSYGLNASYGTSSYGHPTEEYLKAFAKYLQATAPGYTCIGYVSPNSRGAYVCDVYNSGTNSSTGLPEHITGHFFNHGGTHIAFGTSYGKWYYYSFAFSHDIPTKVSQLTNDLGFLTQHQSLANYVTLNTAQTISATKTFSAQQSFTATGKAPFTVSSNVKVDNLNADLIGGYASASLFKRLGWNSNTTYTDADTTSMPFGLIINQQGNYKSNIKNYPTEYGYLLNLSTGDESNYSGVQIYTNQNTDRTYIRSKWGSTWYDWKTLLDSNNWSSFITIPSVGNGTVTINQAGASKGSFTLNQSAAATINLTDTNYYPTAFSWTGGTAEGPTGSLTGVGMTAVSFGAIPSASGSASGIVTTSSQTFAGEKTFHQIRLRQPSTSGSVNYGGYLYFGDGSYAYIAELSDDKLYYRASGGHYFEGLNHNFAPVLVGTIYRKPGETTYSITSNSIGVDSSSGATKNIGISVSRSRAGKYAVTLTNNTPTPVCIHAPVITSSHGDWGGGSCYESPFAYLDHNSTCVFPKLLSAGKTLSFNIICGRIHTQGNWSTGDFTKSDDNSGFICSIYASYSGNTATG